MREISSKRKIAFRIQTHRKLSIMKNIKISPADSGRQRDNANYSCAMKRRMLSPWLTLVNRSSVRVPTKLAIISQVQHCRAQNAPQKSVPVFQSSNIDTNQLPTSGIWSKWRAEKSRNHTVSSIDNGSVRTPPARATHSTFNFAGTRDSEKENENQPKTMQQWNVDYLVKN